MTTRAEMNRRKEQTWEALNRRGASKSNEVGFALYGNWSSTAKARVCLDRLEAEGRAQRLRSGGYVYWQAIHIQVPQSLIDQIEEMARESPFLRWVRRASHDDAFRRGTAPPP